MIDDPPAGTVIAVSSDPKHGFSKPVREAITLLAGLGVQGDAHAGALVKHLFLARRDPTAPNLRQVHLIHQERLDELHAAGFDVPPGAMGENITTKGIDLLALPRGTRLHLGADAVVEITGLRNPCYQLDRYQRGLKAANFATDDQGGVVRKAGIMSIVLHGGTVHPGDPIRVELPPPPHQPLLVV